MLQPYLRESEPLRRIAEDLGRLLVEEVREADETDTRPSQSQDVATSQSGNEPSEALETQCDAPTAYKQHRETPTLASVPLTLGDQTVHVAVAEQDHEFSDAHGAYQNDVQDGAIDDAVVYEEDDREIDLERIERRCRLKAKACRLYIKRRTATGDVDREQPLIGELDEMIVQAKAIPQCFLWMLWRERSQPPDETLHVIARCYDALADAVSVMHEIELLGDQADEEHLAEAMDIAAESHSALRRALEWTWLTSPDIDQVQTHHWLRRESTIRQIYLPRYMRLEDPADPHRADAVCKEAAHLLHRVRQRALRIKTVDQEFKKIRYHVRQIERNAVTEDGYDHRKILEAVEALLDCGVLPTDRRFRQAITAPVADSLSADDTTSPRTAVVVNHVREWHRANRVAESDVATPESRTWSEQVHEVRKLLRGTAVVIIGGEPRPEAEQRIRDAFDLGEVTWVHLTEHGSSDPIRAPIARSETALVIVLVKLAGHQHVEDASATARLNDKPCVRLKAGYNPEQIADAVLQQVSEQLRLQHAKP